MVLLQGSTYVRGNLGLKGIPYYYVAIGGSVSLGF